LNGRSNWASRSRLRTRTSTGRPAARTPHRAPLCSSGRAATRVRVPPGALRSLTIRLPTKRPCGHRRAALVVGCLPPCHGGSAGSTPAGRSGIRTWESLVFRRAPTRSGGRGSTRSPVQIRPS